ncbi:MAG: flagellar M-ring protein FliF [Alphaproteobacteria bacterium]|nr:flagellar M-ring protein FliF [Alphaproteobacteria bacterium]
MNNFLQTLRNLSPGRLIALAGIALFLISFFGYLFARIGSSDYGVLYSDLDLENAKNIVSKLDTEGVKYKLADNGTTILVPSDEINRLRLTTAEFALESGGANVGYEIFDNSDSLGSTSFVQNINLIRALEGELARTIRSVDNIKSARVHLVMPKREMFSREEQQPSASVIIKTMDGKKLSLSSIQSIQKLVSAAVPKLDVNNIAIVDSAGNLLTHNFDNSEAMSAANNEVMRLEQERKIAQKVQSLLENSLGDDSVRAQVNLEMNFDQVVTNEEIYDPDTQVVRSQTSVVEEGVNNTREVPVSVSQNIPNADVVNNNNGSYSNNSRTEEVTNYEISKIVRNKVKNNGEITRMSVAVLVDGVYEKDEEGKRVYRPRTAEEMEKITALVKSIVGYDADRGDKVEVENMRFVSLLPEVEEKQEILILGFTKAELMRMSEGLGVAIVAILVILMVIRPLISHAFESSQSSDTKLIGDSERDENMLLSSFLNDDMNFDDMVNVDKVDGRLKASSLKKVNEFIDKNPDAAVNVIRGWLYQNDSN